MPKQLVDLNKEESEKLDRISKKWNVSKTDAIKRLIRDFKEDPLNDLNLDIGGLW